MKVVSSTAAASVKPYANIENATVMDMALFVMILDDHFQINARFIGTRPRGRNRDFKWVQALSIMFKTQTLVVAAKRVSHWHDNVDALVVRWGDVLVNIHTDGDVKGVLGKTYRPNYVSTVKIRVPMPMIGGEVKYHTPSFLSPAYKACRFQRPSMLALDGIA
ncbi:hypothetical protein FEM48_Zijuj02G0092700 [Ziziphus jujuba var. spinosa]|uniref:Uncharacterized protein n=1 Tax=Ziziphus jujuba var. spinosa TaxID=714518 RepID=A0A978VUW9_ZIZJJ|nr:hypothetical protein FEM48_Zijuj02G0092700 [Ziziphus jujuba var. spinosa]